MKTASAYKALWDGDKQFLSAIAKEVATLVAVPENMDYFRKQITEFADKWRAYKTAYEADSKRKWQPSMGRPKNPLGTIWPLVYGSGWKDGVEKFLPAGPGINLLPYYPCYDIKVVLGACALLAVIHDNILPHCPPIAKDVLPKKLSQEIWRNLITGVDVEDTLGQKSVIRRNKIAGFLIDVRADIGQDATALSEIEKIYFNKYSSAYKELLGRTKKNDDGGKSESTKGADTNEGQNKVPSSGPSYIPTSTSLKETWQKTIQDAEGQKDYIKSKLLSLVLFANELGVNAIKKQLNNLQKIDAESSFRQEADKVKNEIVSIIKQLPGYEQRGILSRYQNIYGGLSGLLSFSLINNMGGFIDAMPIEQEGLYREVVNLSDTLRKFDISKAEKDTVSNAAKNNSTPQTQEQQLAVQIIDALNDWTSVGADNWEEKLPKKYRPNHCLEYRLSIHNKLGINPILEKLMLEGRGDAAKMLEQYRDILDKAVNAINENLDPTSPMHLPNTELSIHAGNLSKALERALPYLGTQPAKGHVQADLASLKPAETEQKERPLLLPSCRSIKDYVAQIETPGELWDFLQDKHEQIYDSCNFGNEPSFFEIISECAIRIRKKHLSLNLPPVPNADKIVAYKNWCIDAQRIIDATALTKTEPVSTKQKNEQTISQLIAQGEGHTIEFKETLEYSVRENKQDTNLNKECLKTIAAFLNTDGGTLLIGVRDNGEITGIERDLPYVQRKNEDGFQLKLRDLIKSNFTPFPSGKIDISFEKHAKETICRVDVEPVNKNQIIHLGKDVYIRDGNITRKLEGRDLTDWIQQRGK